MENSEKSLAKAQQSGITTLMLATDGKFLSQK